MAARRPEQDTISTADVNRASDVLCLLEKSSKRKKKTERKADKAAVRTKEIASRWFQTATSGVTHTAVDLKQKQQYTISRR